MANEPLEGPGQPCGRRLVAGDEERQDLVAEVAVGHVSRGGQQREDVLTGRRAAARDLVEQHGVGLRRHTLIAAPRAVPAQARPDPHQRDRGSQVGHARQQAAQLVQAGRVRDADDRPQDDLQGDRLHARL
jgi:hypothetical protein